MAKVASRKKNQNQSKPQTETVDDGKLYMVIARATGARIYNGAGLIRSEAERLARSLVIDATIAEIPALAA